MSFSTTARRIFLDSRPTNVPVQIVSAMFGSQRTNVMVQETPYGTYVTPTSRHYVYQFEEFFGFGCGNTGYTYNRTVFIPRGFLGNCAVLPLKCMYGAGN